MKRYVLKFILYAILGLKVSSCSGDFLDVTSADISISPYLNFPVGSLDIVMSNVVPDTGIITQDSNRFYISYVVDSALTLYADSLLPEIPNLIFGDSSQLAQIVLPDFSQAADFTLAEFGPTSNLNGGLYIFPPLGPVYGGSQAVQGNSPVCSAVASQGTVTLTVTNSWPVPVQLSIALVNNSNGQTVTNFIFPTILPGSSSSQTKSLVGKSISNNMSLDIVNIQSAGSSGAPVPYTPNDAISFFVQTNAMEVSSGSVVFPQSQLFAASDFFAFGLPNSVRLKEVTVKRAVIRYIIETPIQGVIQTDVTIPFSDNFGSEFGFTITTTPATQIVTGRVVMQNVDLDLSRMPGAPFNRLPLEIESSLVNPSSCIGFNTQSDLTYNFILDSIEVGSVFGQFGDYEFSFGASFDLNSIELGLNYDEIVFYGPKLKLDFENSVGVPIFLDIDLTSSNNYGQFSEQIVDFGIDYPATNAFPLLRESALVVSPDTNLPFIVLPDQDLQVEIEAKIRSTGNPQPPHFISSGEDLNVNVSLVQESRFAVSNLLFSDTVLVSPPDSSTLSQIIEAFWGLGYTNDLPFDVEIDLSALDQMNNALFAKTLTITGRSGESRVDLTSSEIESLKQLHSLVWVVRFNSNNSESPLLKSTDKLRLSLSLGGRLNIEIL